MSAILKKEIEDLEQLLLAKKKQLNELSADKGVGAEGVENENQLIVIVELHDQFYNINDIVLIENTFDSIKCMKETYENSMYPYELKFYKVNDVDQEFEYLKKMLSFASGVDDIQEWMEEHNGDIVDC